ncbi:histidine kinase [soil metagenome]|jgi:two-component system LytT family sensor kinase
MLPIKKQYWLEILLHLLFWTVIFYVHASLTSLSQRFMENINGVIVEKITRKSTYPASFITFGLLMLLFYGNTFWLLKAVLRYRNSFIKFITVLSGAATVFLLNYLLVYLFISHTTITTHEWMRLQVVMVFIFLFTLGLSVAYFFSKEWIRNELLRKQLQAVNLSTEIKFLRSQVNPHFLFNTLNNLFSMAQQKGNDELADGISKLSGMMRYMIYESNADTVPLKNEIEYLKSCIALNKLRFDDDEAKVKFHYPEDNGGLFIAPMIFIPFVENAFKHGVLIGSSSQIDIAISVTGKQVMFTCENKNFNFIKKMDGDAGGIGLENVKRRLTLLYADKFELSTENDAGYYKVKLKINLQ